MPLKPLLSLKKMSLLFPHTPLLFKPHFLPSRNAVVYAAATSASEKKSRRKKQQKQKQQNDDDSGLGVVVSTEEKGLRFAFMEELMDRARNRDAVGVSDVIYDMVAAGLSPGPRTFHGLIVAHALNADVEGAVYNYIYIYVYMFVSYLNFERRNCF